MRSSQTCGSEEKAGRRARAARPLAARALAGASLAAGAAAGAGGPPAPGAAARAAAPGADGERDVTKQNAVRLEEMFAGRFPGVQVYPQGGGVMIRVRGVNTFTGNTEPLFVVDGQVLSQGNGGVLDLNPNDIARIEVLKSATDLAMYGSRSGNGVVRVTTKRPRRPSGGA
jgi:TonB-dependent SusC/RagA subfamily outer membrane receptor